MKYARSQPLPEYTGPYRVCFFSDGSRYLLYETWAERQSRYQFDTSDTVTSCVRPLDSSEETRRR